VINHRIIVSWIFRIGALLIGIPALVALFEVLMFLFLGAEIVQHSPSYPWLDIQKYGIVGMVWNSGEFVKVMFQLLAGLGVVIAIFLSIALIFAIVLAILFFFTGIGVARRADWARVMGIVLSAICVVCWLNGLRGGEHLTDIAFAAAAEAIAVYSIWVLGWRYV
jgi:hypothetical protein